MKIISSSELFDANQLAGLLAAAAAGIWKDPVPRVAIPASHL